MRIQPIKQLRCSRRDERRMKDEEDEEDEMETRSNGVTFVLFSTQ